MNRFLAKKKGKEDATTSRPSIEGDSTSHFKLFGKTNGNFPDNGKKGPDQIKSVLDLSKALPSSDDFRTSLLMTGLSARFSMLREVDDPAKSSKPGDYGVSPKHTQSNLSEEHIHHEALRDQSIRDSSKTGLLGDLDSLTLEEAAPATTSIMNRGKPMEGNNLFGGRQKVYRVPASGTAAAKDGHMPGRALYDQDVPLSGFQKWKQSEREEQMAANVQGDAAEEANSQATPNRVEDDSTTTTKTTTIAPEPRMPHPEPGVSTPAPLAQRTMSVKDPQSTTATANQDAPAADRFVSRAKRLYEQGLNQELADQQTSAFSRMDSLSKTRAFAPMTPEMPSPSSSFSGDRRQVFAKGSAPNLRAVIPNGAAELKSSSGVTPPLSPPISESDGQSSIQRQRSNASLATTRRHIPADIQTTSFFDDSDAMPLPAQSGGLSRTPSLSIERPLDEDHPAFRKNAPPTPSSLNKVSEEGSTGAASSNGLSSMVRAHLRSESAASSVYEDHEEAQNGHNGSARGTSPASGKQTASRTSSSADDEASREQDEFARHLADGARRVREKLTSYVDADPDRAIPLPSSPIETPRELNPPRPSLGLLRSKSSRSSLFDREGREQGRSLRVNISAASIAAALPSPRRLTAEASEESRGSTNQADDEASDGISVGLKAFRQARRELQKVKEVDSPQKPPPSAPRPLALRAMSYEPSAPQAPPSAPNYSRMPRGETRNNGMGSRSGSRAPSERDRSGSDTSTGGFPPSRMRNGSVAHDDQRLPGSPSGSVRRPPTNMGPDARPRTGSKAGTPPTSMYGSLPAPTGAPPLPPLNPRRINGLKGDEESPAASPRMPGGFPMGEGESDDEGAAESRHQRLRRATSEGNSLHGRARTSRPRNESRPPLPQGFSNARFPGGMI